MKMLTYLTLTVILQTPVILFAITSPLNLALTSLSAQLPTSLQNSAQRASPGEGWWPEPRPLWTALCSQESCPGIVYLVLQWSCYLHLPLP